MTVCLRAMREVLTPDAIVALARATYEKYGFRGLQAWRGKAGRQGRGAEGRPGFRKGEAFPRPCITLTPTAAGCRRTRWPCSPELKHRLSLAIRGPQAPKAASPAAKLWRSSAKESGMPTATNMIDTDQDAPSHALQRGYPGRPHFWTMAGLGPARCNISAWMWAATPQPLDISGHDDPVRRRCPAKLNGIDTYRIYRGAGVPDQCRCRSWTAASICRLGQKS